ncbi:MAG: class I SAM-dependent methyltransferase [Candidatus Kuenenia sp.]|nr:class I SAM-dependent methyltransferase [Candidatus Kuenenia sp.]
MNSVDYSVITEFPGLQASQEQIERLYQRYHFAQQFASVKDVLEVACGSGIGLGYLAQAANKVIGVDIEEKNVNLAKEYYRTKFKSGAK